MSRVVCRRNASKESAACSLGIALVATSLLLTGCAPMGMLVDDMIAQKRRQQAIDSGLARALGNEVNVRCGTLNRLGRIDANDALPAGELHHVRFPNKTASADALQEGLLVVNFDAPSSKGERSYLAFAQANCSTGAFTVDYQSTYEGPNSQGSQIAGGLLSPPMAIDKPSASLAVAVQAICEQRKKL